MNNIETFNNLSHIGVADVYLDLVIRILLIIVLILGIVYLFKKVKNQ